MHAEHWSFLEDRTNPGNVVALTGVLETHPKFPGRRMCQAVIPAYGMPDSPVCMGQILRWLLLDAELFRPIRREDVEVIHPTMHRYLVTLDR